MLSYQFAKISKYISHFPQNTRKILPFPRWIGNFKPCQNKGGQKVGATADEDYPTRSTNRLTYAPLSRSCRDHKWDTCPLRPHFSPLRDPRVLSPLRHQFLFYYSHKIPTKRTSQGQISLYFVPEYIGRFYNLNKSNCYSITV